MKIEILFDNPVSENLVQKNTKSTCAYPQSPEGIRLFLSEDGGRTWDKKYSLQMWDVRNNRMLGKPIANNVTDFRNRGVWEALEQFTFGTPDLVELDDGSILLTYYATVDNVIHVRACRFRLDT